MSYDVSSLNEDTGVQTLKPIKKRYIPFIRRRVGKVGLTVLLALMAVIFLFPLILTVSNSFMGEGEIIENYSSISRNETLSFNSDKTKGFANLKLIPDEVTIKQYYTVLIKRIQFLFMFWNSVFIVVPIIAGQTVVGSMAAYAFGKLRFKWREICSLYI